MSFILFFTTGSFLAPGAICFHQGYSSPKVVPEEEDSDVAPVRQGLIHLGLSGKQEALHLLESAAEMLGLDSKKMMEVVLECLDAGRNVESHYMGGIPGFETAMADQELHRRHLFRRSSEHHMDAASIAARALRNRHCTEDGSHRVAAGGREAPCQRRPLPKCAQGQPAWQRVHGERGSMAQKENALAPSVDTRYERYL
eukprot:g3471.t1